MQGSHSMGSICPFSININKISPFTGIFKPAHEVSGLIRLAPNAAFGPGTLGLSPGVAVKFLRSGVPSANIVLIYDFLPLKSYDFFSVFVSNHFDANFEMLDKIPKIKFILKRFCSSGKCINKVGLSHLCSHDQNGIKADENIFPFKIDLVPGEINLPKEEPKSPEDYMKLFNDIPVGSKVYSLKAYLDPKDDIGMILGNIKTTGPCVSSYFGDTKMAFRHQPIEEDIATKPEWTKKYAENCYCNYPKTD